ncbi:MAG: TrkA family potassium uptake protein [Elusimicrobiota bacterium]|nr:TrkA family potassium uptake protein [Elusimicrobiota bacterium]
MKNKKKQFVVIGLGTFGYNVSCELVKHGMQVLAIDRDETIVNEIAPFVTQALILDASDEKAMQKAGITDCDAALISVGDVKTSMLATLIVKDLGVNNIIVKCVDVWHSKVAVKLGANQVIYPELEMAKKFVASIVSPNILEQIQLSNDYNLMEIVAPSDFWDKTLKELDIRNKFELTVIAVRSAVPTISADGQNDIKEKITMVPGSEYKVKQGDVLVVIGAVEALEKFKG